MHFFLCCILQQELETALRKAKLLYTQRQDEYEKAKSCTARAEEEHLSSSGSFVKDFSKQLEKKRRLEEEALQKVRGFFFLLLKISLSWFCLFFHTNALNGNVLLIILHLNLAVLSGFYPKGESPVTICHVYVFFLPVSIKVCCPSTLYTCVFP